MQDVAQLLLNEGSNKSLEKIEKLKQQQELQLIKQMGTT